MQQRRFRRYALERTVRVPVALAYAVNQSRIIGGHQLAAGIEIGNFRDLLHLEIVGDVALCGFQRAEAAAERDLAFIGEMLLRKHQHGIGLKCILDFGEGGGIERAREIDVGDFRAEGGRERADGDGHDGVSLMGYRV